MTASTSELLKTARVSASRGDDGAARSAYLEFLGSEPTHFAALNELGALALSGGYRSAARTAYEQAVRHHPDNPVGRVNLANLLLEDGEPASAREHLEAALAVQPRFAPAHQGMARALAALGENERAAPHWRKGFEANAVVSQPCRGSGSPIPVLQLVSAHGGNVATNRFLDDRVFAVTSLYSEYFDPDEKLPSHGVVFNAIGDADLCARGLMAAAGIAASTRAQIINPPDRVLQTGRVETARRLSHVPNIVVPRMLPLSRAKIGEAASLGFPLLLRAPGFHTGRHFVRVEREEEIVPAASSLPGDTLLAIEYLDARGTDGCTRKYRVMFIDGELYPLHLAVSDDWKIHYFTAQMATHAAHRGEERHFLDDMHGVLGRQAVTALREIAGTLALDYAGIDFALDAERRLLVFEANATMVINAPDGDPLWDYRRPAIARALSAAQKLVRDRAQR